MWGRPLKTWKKVRKCRIAITHHWGLFESGDKGSTSKSRTISR